MTARPAKLTLAATEPGEVTLAGPPRAVRGRLRVANRGSERVAVRGLAIRGDRTELSAAQGTVRARLDPGATSDLDVQLSLPRSTPPGDYPVRLDVEGHEVAALLTVTAEPAVRVSPSTLIAAAGSTPVHLSVNNVGNVALELPLVARSRLVADADLTPPLLGVYSTPGTPTDLDAVLHLAEPVSLPPGAVVELDAVVEVATGLDPERRYLALVPVSTATLRVVVTPTGGATTRKSPTRTTPATRRRHA